MITGRPTGLCREGSSIGNEYISVLLFCRTGKYSCERREREHWVKQEEVQLQLIKEKVGYVCISSSFVKHQRLQSAPVPLILEFCNGRPYIVQNILKVG